ncbi:hypothetical protein DPX16_17274 [Anabarilius grahami]|uniref:Uncharacterized protein n=1 Tax=Anabarilius grahami TaxID=495550 RepID=A0A3N0YB40_ANAGA|nr:hypothetical protein DPX16_17274 [Anabarilius grahami]
MLLNTLEYTRARGLQKWVHNMTAGRHYNGHKAARPKSMIDMGDSSSDDAEKSSVLQTHSLREFEQQGVAKIQKASENESRFCLSGDSELCAALPSFSVSFG